MNRKVYYSINIDTEFSIPQNWVEQIEKVVEEYSYYTHLDGKSSTSREPANSEGSDVFIVDGDIIKSKLKWLYDLYSNEILKFVNKSFKGNFKASSDSKSAININILKGENARYEWHVDSNPVTGLLFVTTHSPIEGGELVFRAKKESLIINPIRGVFIAFDAREIPHSVLPLMSSKDRISIPMNFYFKDKKQARPSDLDEYLYKKNTTSNIKG